MRVCVWWVVGWVGAEKVSRLVSARRQASPGRQEAAAAALLSAGGRQGHRCSAFRPTLQPTPSSAAPPGWLTPTPAEPPPAAAGVPVSHWRHCGGAADSLAGGHQPHQAGPEILFRIQRVTFRVASCRAP